MKDLQKIILKAPAKINLGLKITGKRNDGYHTLQTIFVKISLFDKILIEYPSAEKKIIFTGRYADGIMPEKSTIQKTIDIFKENYHHLPCMKITVEKNIPHGSGLGGGSSDAATLLNFLFNTFLPPVPIEEKIKLAAKIGADVPFFFMKHAAYAEGIGERLIPLPYQFDFYGLIVYPRLKISTKEAFKKFDLRLTQYQKNIIFNPLLTAPLPLCDYQRFLANELEDVAIDMYGELERVRERLNTAGFNYVQMTGSGSAFFALSDEPIVVRQEENWEDVDVFLVRPFSGGV